MAGTLCHRYGPGRLPGADREGVGAGLAMASMGLFAAVLWYGGVGLLLATGLAGDSVRFYAGFGLYFLPATIVTAFVGGVGCWRYVPPDQRRARRGALLGTLVAGLSLLGGAIGFATIVAGYYLLFREPTSIAAALQTAGILVPIGFVFALVAVGWLVVPLGAVAGWYHERATASHERP